jgi:hypothetical protein
MEAYFAIPDDGPQRPVSHYVMLLTEAGCPCHEEADDTGHWVVFDDLESTLNFSIVDGAAVFVTFDMHHADPPELVHKVERVFATAGWSLGDENEV